MLQSRCRRRAFQSVMPMRADWLKTRLGSGMRPLLGVLFGIVAFCGALCAEMLTRRPSPRSLRAPDARCRHRTYRVAGEFRLTIKETDGLVRNIQLNNAYNEYKLDPQRFGDIVQTFTAMFSQPASKAAGLDRTRIVPVHQGPAVARRAPQHAEGQGRCTAASRGPFQQRAGHRLRAGRSRADALSHDPGGFRSQPRGVEDAGHREPQAPPAEDRDAAHRWCRARCRPAAATKPACC